jgi:hypothetical protein
MSQTDGETRQSRSTKQAASGLGLEKFAMSAVRATETQEASEVTSRAWRTVSWIVLVGLIIATAVWWWREGRDVFWRPTLDDEGFLLTLKGQEAAQKGIVGDFEFKGRIRLKFTVNSGLSLTDDESKRILREAVRGLVIAFGNHRQNEDVRVEGYQLEEKVAEGRLRTSAREAGGNPSIWVHIEGEEMGIGGQRPL